MSQPILFARHLEHQAEIEALLIGFMAERHSHMGPDESGFYGFYMDRLKKGRPLIHYDLGLAKWIIENVPPSHVIVDIGTGIGQFPLLLAANGFNCVACEAEGKRFPALQRAVDACRYFRPEWAERVTPLKQLYPSPIASIEGQQSIAVFACFVTTVTPEVERTMVAGLRMFSSAIIDPKRFGRMKRDTPEQVQELLDMLKEERIEIVKDVLNWGTSTYVLVRPM
jgi:hypothetical protein